MDNFTQSTVAVLLENQRLINESPPQQDIAQFRRISIPLVRRVYPTLMANDIVSVQTLAGPTGLNLILNYRYAAPYPQMSTKVDWKREGF